MVSARRTFLASHFRRWNVLVETRSAFQKSNVRILLDSFPLNTAFFVRFLCESFIIIITYFIVDKNCGNLWHNSSPFWKGEAINHYIFCQPMDHIQWNKICDTLNLLNTFKSVYISLEILILMKYWYSIGNTDPFW